MAEWGRRWARGRRGAGNKGAGALPATPSPPLPLEVACMGDSAGSDFHARVFELLENATPLRRVPGRCICAAAILALAARLQVRACAGMHGGPHGRLTASRLTAPPRIGIALLARTTLDTRTSVNVHHRSASGTVRTGAPYRYTVGGALHCTTLDRGRAYLTVVRRT